MINNKIITIGNIFFALILLGCMANAKTILAAEEVKQYSLRFPAEIYCDHKGGKPEIVQNIYGGSNKICAFDDGSECLIDSFFDHTCEKGSLPTIKPVIYFINQKLDPSGAECGLVYPVKYAVGQYQNWESLTLQKLLLGPNEDQVKQGYLTLI
ncbi:MAG: DUF333 domain-containing protein, partial [Patescibacteria group bacterium]